MADRWAIYAEIEGFAALYDRETLVMEAMGDLMEAIYLIGSRCYPETPDRLFAYQFGDAFLAGGEFGAPSLEVLTSDVT